MTIFTLFKRKKKYPNEQNWTTCWLRECDEMRKEKQCRGLFSLTTRYISKRLSRCHRYYMIERKEFRVNVQYILTRNQCCVYITCIWICVISSVSNRSISNRCESRNFLSISLVSEIWFFSIVLFCFIFSNIWNNTRKPHTFGHIQRVGKSVGSLFFVFLNERHEICFFIYIYELI